MPIPTVVAAGTVAQTASGGGVGPITPGLPAGWAADDIHILFCETSNQLVNAISGWSNVGTGIVQQSGASVTALTVRWRRAVAGDTAPSVSAVTGGNHISGRILGVRGCVTSGAPFDTPATSTAGTGTAFSIPGGTTAGPDRLVVAALSTGTDTTSTAHASGWTNASLTSVTERVDNWNVTGDGGGFAAATGGKATAGAYSATTGSVVTSNTKALMSFALIGQAILPSLVMAPMRR